MGASLAACTVGPDYRPPRTTVPPTWGELASAGAASQPSNPTSDPSPLAEWWTTFHDATLDALVKRAVRANPDLRRAEARVREARARRGVVAADRFPALDAAGSAARSRASANISNAPPGAGEPSSLYQVGFDASWEIDLFGGVRRSLEAADADVAAGVEDRRDALVSLLAEVARSYVELRGAQRQAAIARANLGAQTETLELTRARLAAGLASDLDVARAEAQVQATAAQIPSLESAARASIHLLSVLLAQQPNALAGELSREAPIPPTPREVPIGLPSDLLRRRPDVRRAERQLAAATARIGVATADLFPRFSLVGSLGLESSTFRDVGDLDSRFWSIGPSVSWPLLDFGRIRSNVDVVDAREEQAAAVYERTVLTSLREVEDALVSFSREQARRRELAGAVDSNRRAVSLADQLYRAGRTDFLSVLQSQRDLYASEDDLVDSDRRVASDLIALYKALGGGWEVEARTNGDLPRGEPGSRILDLTTTPAGGAP
jgi:NodT family efflux transporter outer membrane factor (OMF) lipoprotein